MRTARGESHGRFFVSTVLENIWHAPRPRGAQVFADFAFSWHESLALSDSEGTTNTKENTMKRLMILSVALATFGYANTARADDLSWYNQYLTPGLTAAQLRDYLHRAQNSWNLMKTERNNAVTQRDAAIAAKNTAIAERNAAIAAKNTAIAERNVAITERDAAISQRNIFRAERDAVIVERNVLRGDLANALADRDRVAAERSALSAALDGVAVERDAARSALATATAERDLARSDVVASESVRKELQAQLDDAMKRIAELEQKLNPPVEP